MPVHKPYPVYNVCLQTPGVDKQVFANSGPVYKHNPVDKQVFANKLPVYKHNPVDKHMLANNMCLQTGVYKNTAR